MQDDELSQSIKNVNEVGDVYVRCLGEWFCFMVNPTFLEIMKPTTYPALVTSSMSTSISSEGSIPKSRIGIPINGPIDQQFSSIDLRSEGSWWQTRVPSAMVCASTPPQSSHALPSAMSIRYSLLLFNSIQEVWCLLKFSSFWAEDISQRGSSR